MFWSKKRDDEKGLPDLPNYPSSRPSMSTLYRPPHHTEEEEHIHSLPSFPDSPMRKGFSQSAIKDAVQEDELPHLPHHEETQEENGPSNDRTMEMDEWKPPRTAIRKVNEEKHVFVRLDKFQSGKQSLEIIKEKIAEIDSLLQTIREIKTKEDQEIMAWEREIESVKARLNSVITEIFDSTEE